VVSRPAVFIDRDGTLTEEVGYVNHPSRLRLLPRSAAAIRCLNQAGVPAVVVTNQAGIARGYFSPEVLDAVNRELLAQLKEGGAHLDGLYVCTHHPSVGEPPYRADCSCRKPKPGLLQMAARDGGLSLTSSYMVGDRWRDVEAGRRAGCSTVFIDRSYDEPRPERPDATVSSLAEAADWILSRD